MDLSKFIYHKEKVFSDEFCDQLVNLFDEREKQDRVSVGSMMGGLDLTIKNTTEMKFLRTVSSVPSKLQGCCRYDLFA
jgi:hypothetical protein